MYSFALKKATVLLIGLTLTACRTTTLLTASFESDAVGTPPARNLAGAPTGDSLVYQAVLEPRLRVQPAASGTGRDLQFSQAPTTGELTPHNQWLSFKGISTNFTQPLWFIWSATNVGGTFGGPVTIYLTDGRAGIIGGLTINGAGQVEVMTGPGNRRVIGTLRPQGVHSFIIALRPGDSQYNISLFQTGASAITVNDIPVFLGNMLAYANPAKPSIDIRFADGNDASRQYVINSASITRRQPPM